MKMFPRALAAFRAALVVALAPAVAHADPALDARAALNAAIGAALQADGPQARRLLQGLDATGLTPARSTLRACMLARLDGADTPAPPSDPFAGRLLDAYRTYWREAVNAPDQRAAAEKRLIQGLAALLGQPGLDSVEAAEPALKDRLAPAGYHALFGRTGLLDELMLWRRQEDRPYTVVLPDGPRVTHVFLLNDFASLGWSSYFTCERASTGGWTKPEGLYAVVPNYDSLEDEAFKVNFLAHESQHFADLERFPGLASWEKEYRAKLVELSQAEATRTEVLDRLAADQGDDVGSPHSYADKRVLAALRRRLGLAEDADLKPVPGDQLRAAAKAELAADTQARTRAASGR